MHKRSGVNYRNYMEHVTLYLSQQLKSAPQLYVARLAVRLISLA